MPIDDPISRADIDKSAERVYTTEEIEQKCDAPDRVRYVSLPCKGRSAPERRIVTAKGRKRATATSGGWKPKCIVRLCSGCDARQGKPVSQGEPGRSRALSVSSEQNATVFC